MDKFPPYSMPKRPKKIGRITKGLVGRVLKIGYNDAPPSIGMIIDVPSGGATIHDMQLIDLETRNLFRIDSRSQIIGISNTSCINLRSLYTKYYSLL